MKNENFKFKYLIFNSFGTKGLRCLLALWVLLWFPFHAEAVRIKDIAGVEGVRTNQLIGYGLVIGLKGTGDKKDQLFTQRTLQEMLFRLGISVDAGDIEAENVAAVMVTATLPPFARPGQRIDALVSSLADAESLQGGTLLLTPLRAADGQVYAVAQGALSLGGFSVQGGGAARQNNHPTVAQIPSGALVEREVPTAFAQKDSFTISLNNPDFTTSSRVAEALNRVFGEATAHPVNAGSVTVNIPQSHQADPVGFFAALEGLEVVPDSVAKVVLDERTGTVVMGENVRISTVAISHGSLSIQIKEEPEVSQPEPLSEGETVVVPRTQIGVREREARLLLVPRGTTIGELVKGLNAVGATPRDFIAIFQALKAAGALHAVLEIM